MDDPGADARQYDPAPGWYPDPSGVHDARWWDGSAWTEHTQAESVQGPLDPRSGLPLAGLGARVIAYLIDFALFFALLLVFGIFANVVSVVSQGLGDFVGILGAVMFFGGSVAYLIVGDGGRLGQTAGKHLQGIRVIGPAPGPIGYGTAFVRYVGRIVDTIFLGVPLGLGWAFLDAERRTWHDMIANTRVVKVETPERSLRYWLENVRV